MPSFSADLAAARDAYAARDWAAARLGFRQAQAQGPLDTEDLAALADAAWWMGLIDESLAASEEHHRRCVAEDDPATAAMAAIEVGYAWALRGEEAIASGWLARARRLLAGLPECAAHGYVMFLDLDAALAAWDFDTATDLADRVQRLGERCHDPALVALGLVGHGMALTKSGQLEAGNDRFDEAMLAVVAGDVSPGWAGNIYCQLMSVCHELADLQRARHWTETTERWCDGLSSAVMFTGICRVHRAQLLQVQGHWNQAEIEARQVCDDLADMNVATVAEGHYQVGEARRLRGDHRGAALAYTEAEQLGRDPQPGLALLRLAEGQPTAAAAALRTALAGNPDPFVRARLRSAQVQIAAATADASTATEAAADLTSIAARYGSPGLEAMAGAGSGTALIVSGESTSALPVLWDACRRWQALEAPYEAARVQVLIAEASSAVGDHETAARNLDLAAATFERLGALPDSRRVATLRPDPDLPGGLTLREAEVLACVASGQTNREVAATLFISDKTVARHLSNIFTKLDVASRTEAAAYAFTHGLATHRRG